MECLLEFATPSQEKLNCFQSKADGIFRKLHLRHLYCRYEAGGGLRNRIIHDHESINLRFVWEIITEDILELREITKAPLCRKIGVLHQGVIIWGNGNGQIAIQTWRRCRTGRLIQKLDVVTGGCGWRNRESTIIQNSAANYEEIWPIAEIRCRKSGTSSPNSIGNSCNRKNPPKRLKSKNQAKL